MSLRRPDGVLERSLNCTSTDSVRWPIDLKVDDTGYNSAAVRFANISSATRTMNKHIRANTLVAGLLALTALDIASADNAKILAADFQSLGSHRWSVSVTLKHGDTGWDHYSDRWRVVDDEGNVLGDRVLFHPHVEEQPFTRGLGSVHVPEGTTTVRIEVHNNSLLL